MSRTIQVTFDAHDPQAVARFWADTLGYTVPESASVEGAGDNSWSALVDPDGTGPRIYIQRVPEDKVAKNRLHLDVRAAPGLTGDERMAALEEECTRLIELGGSRIRRLEANDEDEGIIVMADPEGNEFCLD